MKKYLKKHFAQFFKKFDDIEKNCLMKILKSFDDFEKTKKYKKDMTN